MKNNLPYYRHYSDSHNHPKFKMLRVKYGWDGEGKFWALNNMIAGAENCELDLARLYNKASIALDLNFTLEEFDDFLDYLSDPDACNLLRKDGEVYSNGLLQENLQAVMGERKSARDRKHGISKDPGTENGSESIPELPESSGEPSESSGERKNISNLKNGENGAFGRTTGELYKSSGELSESSGEECHKVKESKVNKINESDDLKTFISEQRKKLKKHGAISYPADFENWWLAYGAVGTKKKALRCWLLCLESGATKDQLIQAAQRNVIYCKTKNQFTQNGSTFLGPDEPWRDRLNWQPGEPIVVVKTKKCPACNFEFNGTAATCNCGLAVRDFGNSEKIKEIRESKNAKRTAS